jgi:hypothetical protein
MHDRTTPGGVHWTVKSAAFHLLFECPAPGNQSISLQGTITLPAKGTTVNVSDAILSTAGV